MGHNPCSNPHRGLSLIRSARSTREEIPDLTCPYHRDEFVERGVWVQAHEAPDRVDRHALSGDDQARRVRSIESRGGEASTALTTFQEADELWSW
jgi:hypothetical protein